MVAAINLASCTEGQAFINSSIASQNNYANEQNSSLSSSTSTAADLSQNSASNALRNDCINEGNKLIQN